MRGSSPVGTLPALERRRLPCRRRTSSLWNLRSWGIGARRRCAGRRADDQAATYVDLHPPHLLLIALLTFSLSAADAHITLALMQRGATEVNVLMAALLRVDVGVFLWTKLFITALALLFLVAHAPFVLWQRLKVQRLLEGALVLYVALIGYELVLLQYAR